MGRGKGKGSHGSGYGRCKGSSKGSGGKHSVLPELDSSFLSHTELEPKIHFLASYSYTEKSMDSMRVVSPAWPVRKILWQGQRSVHIDLSLARGLSRLQLATGAFQLTPDFTRVLGLASAQSALDFAGPNSDVVAALLVLKTMMEFQPLNGQEVLRGIEDKALKFCCSSLHLLPEEVLQAIAELKGPTFECLPGREALLENFEARDRWSFYELQVRLIPEAWRETARASIFCARYFLVDLASAPLDFFEVDKSYRLLRQGDLIFVAAASESKDRMSSGRDALRQGHHFEASIVSDHWLEEDHLITCLELGDVRAIYSAAPDAVDPRWSRDNFFGRGASSYAGLGYEACEVLPPIMSNGCQVNPSCELFQAQPGRTAATGVQPQHFVEVKKTTHLNGRPGLFKKLKFYAQAKLMNCGGVVVGLTDGSEGDTVLAVEYFSVEDLVSAVGAGLCRRMWATLAELLRRVRRETRATGASATSAWGAWTVTLRKDRGCAPVELRVTQGWGEGEGEGGAGMAERLQQVAQYLEGC
ncbi:unnamed protein product [Effrenium voratum]|uniref:Uncharacterized protein n=1 Tax=Effrenium voratum TaxID=2562239 RepID=A0AA36MXT1_9DINO|nr:unnamed protein product [Effrenium voratum]CAJ1423019.1 unnamed protein product [Effrenium voratum]